MKKLAPGLITNVWALATMSRATRSCAVMGSRSIQPATMPSYAYAIFFPFSLADGAQISKNSVTHNLELVQNILLHS